MLIPQSINLCPSAPLSSNPQLLHNNTTTTNNKKNPEAGLSIEPARAVGGTSGDFALVVIKSKESLQQTKPKGLNFTFPTTIFAVSTRSDLMPNLCDFSLYLDLFSDFA